MKNRYDSSYLGLPHIPFIIELPDLCYKVHIPLCTAAQKYYLSGFELIPNIGYKAIALWAYCSKFTILRKDGYGIDFIPENWSIERESVIDGTIQSLDVMPAVGEEAWVIYSLFRDHNQCEMKDQIIHDLDNFKVSLDYVKKYVPDIGKYHFCKDEIERAVSSHVMGNKPITNNKSKKRITEFDLIESHFWLLKNGIAKNRKEAIKNSILLFYPKLTRSALECKIEATSKKIRRHFPDRSA